MTTKILFWVDRLIYYHGIAKYIQKNYPCDMYVIYEVDSKLKKIFQEQKYVKFQKEWYFWDEIKLNDKPDLEYLKTFEKKYGINLWLWVYNDRLLYKYNQIHKFKFNELLSITEQECKFYEKILDDVNPDCLIIKTTDSHRTHLLKLICNAKKIKTLMMIKSRVEGWATISEDNDGMSLSLHNTKIVENSEKLDFDINDFVEKGDASKFHGTIVLSATTSLKRKFLPAIKWLLRPFDKEYKKAYVHYGISKLKVLKIQMLTYIRIRYRKRFIDKKFARHLPTNQKFVYYTLHVQPERTVSIDSPFNNNQIDIITNIAKSVPVDFVVCVKEHPTQIAFAWHPISYYKKLLALPNVILLHPSIKSKKILKECSLVATIGGTVGLECGFYNKQCIMFRDTGFSHLSHIHRIKNMEELPNEITNALSKQVNVKEIEEHYEKIRDISFNINEGKIDNDIMNTFFHGNWTIRNDITSNELEQYFEERQSTFEEIAKQFIKKIENFKS